MNDFLQKVKKTISAHCLIQKGDQVLVALSGGADSVCLLFALLSLAKEMDFSVSACHLHHGLRGEDADNDALFAEALCCNAGVSFYRKNVDIFAAAKEQSVSLEEAGRNARYSYFRQLQKNYGFTKIATAHHRDDNIETVLMRLIRGTGPMGLGGIPYENQGVIRPLLDVSREEIEEFLKENHQDYRTDETNFEQNFTRNKIRHRLLPLLEQEFNPNFREVFLGEISIFSELRSYMEESAKALLFLLAEEIPSGFCFFCEKLAREPKVIVEQMLYLALAKLSAENSITRKHVFSVMSLLSEQSGKIDLPGELVAELCHGHLYVHKEEAFRAFSYDVTNEETIYIAEIDSYVSIGFCDALPERISKNEVYLDAEKLLGKKLKFRSREDGDFFYLTSTGGRKKLQDYFVDKKIPRFMRDGVPLLAIGREILWIGGFRVNTKYQMKKGQRKGLCLRIHKEEKP